MKLTKAMKAVVPGEIYPTEFKKGDDCPNDMVEIAVSVGALPETAKPKAEKEPETKEDKASAKKAPENK